MASLSQEEWEREHADELDALDDEDGLSFSPQAKRRLSQQFRPSASPLQEGNKRARVDSDSHSVLLDSGQNISATSASGHRVHISLHAESPVSYGHSPLPSSSPSSSSKRGRPLLHVPVSILRTRPQSRSVTESPPDDDGGDDGVVDGGEGDVKMANDFGANGLWVDRYSPKSFTELLSNERINRGVLHWLKQWDPVVFPKAPTEGVSPLHAFASPSKPEAAAPLPLPEQRVLLLCGPPGLGKTTLAHVVAAHAGYRAVEMNASNDRSAKQFKRFLSDATQMASVYGERKPNCLIIDEIDGASGNEEEGAIKTLLDLVEGKGSKKKKGAKNMSSIRRPVICICNDQYAPVLRRLRAVASVFVLGKPEERHLLNRLEYICRLEKVPIDRGALSSLCHSADNDIRSCLNTLQFLQSRMRSSASAGTDGSPRALGAKRFQGIRPIGRKDVTESVFEVWENIFRKGKPRKTARGPDGRGTERTGIDMVYDKVRYHTETSRVLDGCFENYTLMRYIDPVLDKTCDVMDTLCIADQFEALAMSDQVFTLNNYTPVAAMTFHQRCGTKNIPRMKFPRSQTQCRQNQREIRNILNLWIQGLSASISPFWTSPVLVRSLAPVVTKLITTGLPLNISKSTSLIDRGVVDRVVDMMVDYGLRYQERMDDHHSTWNLHPPLGKLIELPDIEVPSLTSMQKQNLSILVEVAAMRRKDAARAQTSPNQTKAVSTPVIIKAKPAPIKAPTAPLVTRDFFGRIIAPAKPPQDGTPRQTGAAGDDEDKGDDTVKMEVLYKFKEGFTNAVKRVVHMSDLL